MDENTERKQSNTQGIHMMDNSADLGVKNDQEKLRQAAHAHLQGRQWHEAEIAFTALLGQDGEDQDAMLGLAVVLDRLEQYDRMYETAEHAAQLDPGSALALACKARALQKLDHLSEATIANDQALLLDTNLALAWFNRSGQQLLQERYPEALVNTSLARNPDYLIALEVKGDILRRYARLQEVVQTMSHALQIAPDDVACLNLMAHALRTLGEYDALLEVTRKLVLLTPDSLFAWESHMYALRGLGRFEEAEEAIDHVLELDSTNVRYWMIKADNLYRQHRYREAVSVSERALQIDEEYAPAQRIHEKAMKLMYQQKRKKK